MLYARQSPEFLPSGQNEQNFPTIIGADVLEISQPTLLVQAVLALAFLVVAVMTWRGKPASVRLIFVGLVFLLTAGNLIQLLTFITTPLPSPQTGIDSAGDLSRTLAVSQLCVTLLIPGYIIWYMNRGPARAFFRGHYLPDPDGDPVKGR